jgi:hypothetical protein
MDTTTEPKPDIVEKPRSDAKLKTLPEDRQAEIALYALDHTLVETRDWLQANGIDVSHTVVSRFLTWHHLKQQMAKNELVVSELLKTLAEQNPNLTAERLAELGQIFFASLALEKQDPKAWYLAQQISLRKAHLQLACQKFSEELQARKESIQRELDAAKSSGGLSAETIAKIERELRLFPTTPAS